MLAANPIISPNLHVVLVHFPLALLVSGLVLEVLCGVVARRSGLRAAGRWMILLGALLAIPTALSGMYAFADVARRSIPVEQRAPRVWDQPWWQVVERTRMGDPDATLEVHATAWRMLKRHGWVQAPATALVVFVVVCALALSDRWRRRLYLPILLALLGAAGLMIWGAWYSGESVYRLGAAVGLPSDTAPRSVERRASLFPPLQAVVSPPNAPPPSPAPPFVVPPAPHVTIDLPVPPATTTTTPATSPATAATTEPEVLPPPRSEAPSATTTPTTRPAPAETVAPPRTEAPPVPVTQPVVTHSAPADHEDAVPATPEGQIAALLPPMQVHLIVAGCAVAAALAALGLSMRAAAHGRRLDAADEAELLRDQVDEPGRRRATADDVAVMRSFKPEAALSAADAEAADDVPVGRTWLLALLLAVGAAVVGIVYLAHAGATFERARQEHRPFYNILWEQVIASPPEGFSADAVAASSAATGRLHSPTWLTRRLAHVIGGGAIIVLSLLLAAFARWARQRRLLLALGATLLLLVVASQIWLGVLMLFDTPAGDVTHFQRPPPSAPFVATTDGTH